MPMTVIRVSRQGQAHPPVALGLDDASVPVSATAKLAPDDRDLRRRNFRRRCRRAAPASAAGSSVRSGIDIGHLAQEDVADLGPVAVDRRHQDVRGLVVPELDDQLGQVGLPGRDARGLSASFSPISWVAIDLTLTTSSAPVARTRSIDDLVGLGGVAGPVHGARRGR